MTKIKNVEEKVKDNGKKSYKFFLEDGVSGYITNDKPWEWKVGEEVTYTKEEKKTANGSYNLLTLTRTTQSSSAPAQQPQKSSTPLYSAPKATGKTKEELKSEASIRIMEVFLDAFFSGKIESGKIAEDHKEYVQLVWAEIDDAFSAK